MRKSMLTAVLLSGLLALTAFAGEEPAAAPTKLLGGAMVDVHSLTAKVQSVDAETREVVLVDDAGETLSFVAGDEVRNFAQIDVGDILHMEYRESVSIFLSDLGEEAAREDKVATSRAAEGDKPAGVIAASTVIAAVVEAVDTEARTVTLRGPERTLTITVEDDAPNFDQVAVGDNVFVEIAGMLAVAVVEEEK